MFRQLVYIVFKTVATIAAFISAPNNAIWINDRAYNQGAWDETEQTQEKKLDAQAEGPLIISNTSVKQSTEKCMIDASLSMELIISNMQLRWTGT